MWGQGVNPGPQFQLHAIKLKEVIRTRVYLIIIKSRLFFLWGYPNPLHGSRLQRPHTHTPSILRILCHPRVGYVIPKESNKNFGNQHKFIKMLRLKNLTKKVFRS